MTRGIMSLAQKSLEIVLTNEPHLKKDKRFHRDFIVGFVQAMADTDSGDPSDIHIDASCSTGFKRGYEAALTRLGIEID